MPDDGGEPCCDQGLVVVCHHGLLCVVVVVGAVVVAEVVVPLVVVAEVVVPEVVVPLVVVEDVVVPLVVVPAVVVSARAEVRATAVAAKAPSTRSAPMPKVSAIRFMCPPLRSCRRVCGERVGVDAWPLNRSTGWPAARDGQRAQKRLSTGAHTERGIPDRVT